MNVMNILGFIIGLVVGLVVPIIVAGYVVRVLQVTGVDLYAMFLFVFLIVSALVKWSLCVMLNGDDEV